MIRLCRPYLGTFVEVIAPDRTSAEAGFAAIAEVHAMMSVHDPVSALSRVNRTAHLRPITVPAKLAAVLERSLHWAMLSEGAFDPAIGGRMRLSGVVPRHDGDPAPDPAANWRDVALAGDRVFFTRPLALDLNGIAKGYAVDLAVAAMRTAGAETGLANAGGDLRGFGPEPWPVTIFDPSTRTPMARLAVQDGAVATSAGLPGNDGLEFTHLPGRDAQAHSASVLAPAAMDADALAKVLIAGVATTAACLESAAASGLVVTRQGIRVVDPMRSLVA